MPQAEMTTISSDAAVSSTTRQAPKKRGRPRKTPENGGALTPKEVRENILSECPGFLFGSFQRLIYRSAAECNFSMLSVPTSHERK